MNYNYYDSKALTEAVRPFMEQSLRAQLKFGIHTDVCYVLGTGKNFQFAEKLNAALRLFDRLIALEHPRYVMQYKFKEKDRYVKRFVRLLRSGEE